jgi:nickel-dependent lactate racemase
MTRGTPVARVVPSILEELAEAGIADNQIRLICALGAHEAWDRITMSLKVGEDIVSRFQVHNHCCFLNCTYLGKTSYGSRVEVNSEVMACDLKIAISGVVPHPSYGFGGGGKIVMPGVSSYDSIFEHHGLVHRPWRQKIGKISCDGKGMFDDNPQPKDAMEFAKMAGIDFSIDCILNQKGEAVAIFAGELQQTHTKAVAMAKEHYRVADTRDNDIAIANAFCKSNEATIAQASAFLAVNRNGGDAVTIANSPLGQIVHYLGGAFGKFIGGRNQGRTSIPSYVNHCIFYSEFPEGRNIERFAQKDRGKVLLLSNWTDVIMALKKWHGDKAKVAVFPDGTNQYVKQD